MDEDFASNNLRVAGSGIVIDTDSGTTQSE